MRSRIGSPTNLNKSNRLRAAAMIVFLCFCVIPAFGATNLIKNGSFETPKVPVGGFTLFAKGTAFSQWTVVGVAGNMAIVSGNFVGDGLAFVAKGGKQWVDLTGLSNTATGIAQTVATTPGAFYTLSFFVGNVVDPRGAFGASSTVRVKVNGKLVLTAQNSMGAGVSKQVWQKFTMTIKATGPQTAISFINGDKSNDEACGLDAVSLTLNPPGVE